MTQVQTGIPQLQTPFVDTRTGAITKPWYMLLINLWARTGGGTGEVTDISSEFFGDSTGDDGAGQGSSEAALFSDDGVSSAFDDGALLLADDATGQGSGLAAPFVPVTVGASPLVYVAPQAGTMWLSGGTITAVFLVRSGVPISTAIATSNVPVAKGDTFGMTFTVAPVVHFIPRD